MTVKRMCMGHSIYQRIERKMVSKEKRIFFVVVTSLTCLRIAVSLLLILLPLNSCFYGFYSFCGVSDMLDGYLARRWKVETEFGSKLDSVADFIFFLVAFLKLSPVVFTDKFMIYAFFAVVIFRVIVVFIAYQKFREFVILHTWSNKAVGFLLFLYPLILFLYPLKIYGYLLFFIAILATVEELTIHLLSCDCKRNRKSVFHLTKQNK